MHQLSILFVIIPGLFLASYQALAEQLHRKFQSMKISRHIQSLIIAGTAFLATDVAFGKIKSTITTPKIANKSQTKLSAYEFTRFGKVKVAGGRCLTLATSRVIYDGRKKVSIGRSGNKYSAEACTKLNVAIGNLASAYQDCRELADLAVTGINELEGKNKKRLERKAERVFIKCSQTVRRFASLNKFREKVGLSFVESTEGGDSNSIPVDPVDTCNNLDGDFSDGRCDLTGANLSGMDLSGMDLSGANLSGLDLSGADLRGANLSDADLSQTYLSFLTTANLSGADLNGADLSGAKLSDANLSNVNLSGAKLIGAELRRVNLSDADLTYADLSDADLWGSSLFRTKMTRAKLISTNLTRASLMRANLQLVDLTFADLSFADIRYAYLKDANDWGMTQTQIIMIGGELDNTKRSPPGCDIIACP